MQLSEHPDSVVIVPLDGDRLVVVRQTRPGATEPTLELPSGKLEPGETPADAAARELAEECGLAAREWRELGSFWAAPAYSTEYVHVSEARGLHAADPADLDEDEDVEVERRPVAEGLGGLSDAASVAALALWREAR
jgi:8-oxo-dGTP pyrophosphatase MutT (NUDIX family)